MRTLTLITLGIDDALYKTLRTTNEIDNLNGSIARYTLNWPPENGHHEVCYCDLVEGA